MPAPEPQRERTEQTMPHYIDQYRRELREVEAEQTEAETLADRLSGAPHAAFEHEATEAFQGIRAELDEVRNICRKLTEAVLVLAQPEPSRWSRFRAWLYSSTTTG